MTNLLPLERQKQLQKEYWYRVFIVGVVMVSIPLLLFFVVLGTLYFTLRFEKSQIEELNANNLASPEVQDDLGTINDLQGKLQTLSFSDLGSTEEPFSLLVGAILGAKNETIHIKEITIQAEVIPIIDVMGIADTREGFVEYLGALEDNPLFSSVESPVSNLSKSTNINFSIILSVTSQSHEKQ